MNQREALKLALEALGHFEKAGLATLKTIDAITAIREALALSESSTKCEETSHAQPEQEPVAWMNKHGACMSAVFKEVDATGGEYTTPLYTTPPHRKPLTDEEIGRVAGDSLDAWSCARAIEQTHGIWPENSDCYGSDWTDRDGEYLK